MPVIRLTTAAPAFRREQRQALLDQLSRELAGQATEKGPVVFEVPLDQTVKMDVLVVWEAWKDVLPHPQVNLESQLIGEQRRQRLAEAVGALSTLQRRCLDLRFEGLLYREIAEILDVTVRTVGRDWDKARLLLREMLDP